MKYDELRTINTRAFFVGLWKNREDNGEKATPGHSDNPAMVARYFDAINTVREKPSMDTLLSLLATVNHMTAKQRRITRYVLSVFGSGAVPSFDNFSSNADAFECEWQ